MAIECGINSVVERLKADPSRIERVCIQQGLNSPRLQKIIDSSREHHVPLSFEPKGWMDRKTEGRRHQGVVCFVAEIPVMAVEELIAQAKSPGLLVVLDQIGDPQNLGAILRSAEVAGADGTFLSERRGAWLSPSVVKASAGAVSHINIARASNVVRLVELLKQRGYWVVGLDAGADRLIWDADLTIPTALVFGNEATGLRRLVRETCDFLVSIPTRGKVASYNVSVAAGIALYEVARQRSMQPRSPSEN